MIALLLALAAAAPAVTARATYEDFEYGGVLPTVPWPNAGGWMVGPYGLPAEVRLDHVVKGSGDHSMRFTYRIGSMPQAAVTRLYYPALRWDAYDAVRFWLRPDGSGRRLCFFLMEKHRADQPKRFFEDDYDMTGTEPVLVTMPLARFHVAGDPANRGRKLDWSLIEETGIFVRMGKGTRNADVASSIWIDDIEVVKLAAPLDHVVAVPAPARAPARTPGTMRIDFGAEADWVDSDGNAWTADMPGSEGVLWASPDLLVVGARHPELYRTERRGVRALHYKVPDGRYHVALHFAETDPAITGPGRRVFSVDVEGARLEAIDPWAEASAAGVPVVRATTVDVKDGSLDLAFRATRGTTTLSALEILPADAPEPPRPVVALTARAPAEPQVVEDFESTATVAPLAGDPVAVALDRHERKDGDFGLRIEYALGRHGRAGIRVRRARDLRGGGTLRFWLRADGSGNRLWVGARAGAFYQLPVPLDGTGARTVEIPLADLFPPGADLAHADELRFVVERVDGGRTRGRIYVDRVEIATARPRS